MITSRARSRARKKRFASLDKGTMTPKRPSAFGSSLRGVVRAVASMMALLLVYNHFIHRYHIATITDDAYKPTITMDHNPIAFFISVHEGGACVKQIRRQLGTLYQPHHIFFYHIDSISSDAFVREIKEMLHDFNTFGVNDFGEAGPNVHLMRMERMGWGGVGTVQLTLQALGLALQQNRAWSHFINLSGNDYPARAAPELEEYLASHPSTTFVPYGLYPPALGNRLENIYTTTGGGKIAHTGIKRMPDVNTKTIDYAEFNFERDYAKLREAWNLPADLLPYKGSAWMVLSRAFCQYIIDHLTEWLPLLVYSTTIAAPDEFFFPTLLFNSPFNHTTPLGSVTTNARYKLCGLKENGECGKNLRYLTFPGNSAHPATLTLHDLDTIKSKPDAFFVRKVKKDDSTGLMDELDRLNSRHYYNFRG